MKKKLLKSVALLLVIPGLLLLFSCAEPEVQSTKPDAPDAQLDEGKVVADEEAAQRAIEEEAIRKEQDAARNMFINEDVYFDFNDASLKSESQSILQRKADWLQNNSEASVLIEGHCDERGTTEYNLALGDRRANSVKSFLVDMGIAPSRLKMISYGEEMPVDKGQSETAWAKNRRAHFSIE
jgi:peptidoglycan-associated lipoprotein